MKRLAALLLVASLQACATGASVADSPCTFANLDSRAEFAATAKELESRVDRDDDGLHITLAGEPGSASSFAKALMARESACCPFLRFRFDQGDEVNVLHVSADNNHKGDLDRIYALLRNSR